MFIVTHSAQRIVSPGTDTISTSISSDCQAIRFYNESETETVKIYVAGKTNYFTLQPLSWSTNYIVEKGGFIKTEFYFSFNGNTGYLFVQKEYHQYTDIDFEAIKKIYE